MVYTNGNTMSKLLSLKLQEETFKEMEKIAKRLGRARNAYINDAIAHFNRIQERRELAEILARDCARARDESMKVLAEFEALDDPIA